MMAGFEPFAMESSFLRSSSGHLPETPDKGKNAHKNGNTDKNREDFFLTPAAHLKMVVDRGHAENPLAVGELKVGHLHDDGNGLHDVDDTDQNQHQRHIERERKAADHTAEEQRACVSHEDLRRMEVIDEEARKAAR